MTEHQWYELDIEVIQQMSSKVLQMFSEIITLMETNNGRFPTPESLLQYFEVIGLSDVSKFYFEDEISAYVEEHAEEIALFKEQVNKSVKTDLDESTTEAEAAEYINSMVKEMFNHLDSSEFLKHPFDFINGELEDIDIANLTENEKELHAKFWLNYKLFISNHLSIAVHGKTITALVKDAVDTQNDEAMFKAIQMDPLLIAKFTDRIGKKFQSADIDFIDKLSYRMKNPTLSGEVKHPLLWILFIFLRNLGKYCPALTNAQLLQVYNNSLIDFPDFYIADVQIIQRQRKRFNEM